VSLLRNIASGLRSLFRKERIEGELDEELRSFLEMAAEEKIKQGVSRKEALRAVRLERGSVEVTKEVLRSAGWESFVEMCWQDLRFASGMLRKNLGFTAVAVLTLALGIGANTAMFSVMQGVVLAPLQYANPDRLVMVWENNPRFPRTWVSYPNFRDWQRSARSFQQMAAFREQGVDFAGPGTPEHLSDPLTSWSPNLDVFGFSYAVNW
jgi:MacB-like periplasmic core domain